MVPLAAEELEAERRERQAGEVCVHEEVVTENQQVAVPATREEVHVERVPAQGSEAPGQAAFREGTVEARVDESGDVERRGDADAPSGELPPSDIGDPER